jgi:hypothetical protein
LIGLDVFKFRKAVPQCPFAELAELGEPIGMLGQIKFRREVPQRCGTCGTAKFRTKVRTVRERSDRADHASTSGSFSTQTSGFSTGRTALLVSDWK